MENKLKIAVCFFGHLRTYEKCAEFLKKNLFAYYDCDLFIHTWDTLNHNTQTWHGYNSDIKNTDKEKLQEVYGGFKKIEIEHQNIEDCGNAKFVIGYKSPARKISIFGINSMYHSMKQVNKLWQSYAKEQKIKYDYVLFIRPDILIRQKFDIAKIMEALSPKEIKTSFFTFAKPFFLISKNFAY